jgi:hypothetical protein
MSPVQHQETTISIYSITLESFKKKERKKEKEHCTGVVENIVTL